MTAPADFWYALRVDPGIRGAGVALGAGRHGSAVADVLVRAAYIASPAKKGRGFAEHVALALAIEEWVKQVPVQWLGLRDFACEHPRAYLPGKQSGDQNDLFGMVGVGGALAARMPSSMPLDNVRTLFPDEWKLQVDKFVMNERVWLRLSSTEQACVHRRSVEGAGSPKAGVDHNTYDAVGIFLHYAGRLERRRNFPG